MKLFNIQPDVKTNRLSYDQAKNTAVQVAKNYISRYPNAKIVEIGNVCRGITSVGSRTSLCEGLIVKYKTENNDDKDNLCIGFFPYYSSNIHMPCLFPYSEVRKPGQIETFYDDKGHTLVVCEFVEVL